MHTIDQIKSIEDYMRELLQNVIEKIISPFLLNFKL